MTTPLHSTGVRGRGAAWCAVALTVALAGCHARTPAPLAEGHRALDCTIVLNHHGLVVHLSMPKGAPRGPLLVFTTGDGGWRGKDLELFKEIETWGYPTAGFSARDYVSDFGAEAETTTPVGLGHDYLAIIRLARTALRLPAAHPVILIGVSRGAGLEVVAAGQRAVRRELTGVVAIALTREEEYVRYPPTSLSAGARRDPDEPPMVDLYPYLSRLRALPIAVIQSAQDDYLPAAEARQLFGPDTAHRRLQTIDADDHSFGSAREEMYQAARGAILWVERVSRQ